jgi:hypothetical protein
MFPSPFNRPHTNSQGSKSVNRIATTMIVVFGLMSVSIAFACNVPVFRYALERWPADLYELVIIHQGKLDQTASDNVQSLQELSHKADGTANFNLRMIAATDIQDDLVNQIWKEHGSLGKPVLALLYPRNAQEIPDRLVTATTFSNETVERLTESPVREQLVNELLNGESAVWIFVPGGDKEQDAAALERLNRQVAKSEKELELPPQDEIEEDEFFRIENPIELRLGFSVVTLDRNDPREQFMLAMLLGSESDLETLNEPMAFPVLGRGRVLYALVGKGIFPDTIKSASRFMVGPCSCQVKEQNPGFDLLLSVAWDDKLGGSVLSNPAPERSAKPVLIDIPKGK